MPISVSFLPVRPVCESGEFLVYDEKKKGILQLGRFLEIVLEMGSSHSWNARSFLGKKKDQKSKSKKQNAISKHSCRTAKQRIRNCRIAKQRKQSWFLHIEASKDRSIQRLVPRVPLPKICQHCRPIATLKQHKG